MAETGGRSEASHSALLLALPAHRIAQLNLQTGGDVDHTILGEIEYPPVASVVLGFPRDAVAHPLDGFGVLVPEVEKFHILGAIFSSSLFPRRAPRGHVTLTCYLGGARAPELALLDPDQQTALVVEDLRALLGVTGSPTFAHHHLFRRAIPQYNVGYGRFKDVMNGLERENGGLFLAGHCRDGISLADSIVAGGAAAEKVSRFLNSGEQRDQRQASATIASEGKPTPTTR
jgi:oxygen-dependent protoporphyrinogen oxidase